MVGEYLPAFVDGSGKFFVVVSFEVVEKSLSALMPTIFAARGIIAFVLVAFLVDFKPYSTFEVNIAFRPVFLKGDPYRRLRKRTDNAAT